MREHYEVTEARSVVAELRSKYEAATPEQKPNLLLELNSAEKSLNLTIEMRTERRPSQEMYDVAERTSDASTKAPTAPDAY